MIQAQVDSGARQIFGSLGPCSEITEGDQYLLYLIFQRSKHLPKESVKSGD